MRTWNFRLVTPEWRIDLGVAALPKGNMDIIPAFTNFFLIASCQAILPCSSPSSLPAGRCFGKIFQSLVMISHTPRYPQTNIYLFC